MATKKNVNDSELSRFKDALIIISKGNALDKNDVSIQIATKALQEDGE